MGSSQNSDLILVPLDMRCCKIIYNQNGPIILVTTHMVESWGFLLCCRSEYDRKALVHCSEEAKDLLEKMLEKEGNAGNARV